MAAHFAADTCAIPHELNRHAVSPRRALYSMGDHAMKISARNKLQGKIIEVKKGATTAHVRLEIAPGQIITASITNEAVEELGLKPGAKASAVIKASDVMIATD
jgi:molybdopterin-binding protein